MDYSLLVSELLDGNTIKLPCLLTPATKAIHASARSVILDTGASRTAFTREFLQSHGYGRYTISTAETNTVVGLVRLKMCAIQGLQLANNFAFSAMDVNVLEGWVKQKVVGVIGMDILTRMTFLISHESKQFLLTDKKIPPLVAVLKGLNPYTCKNIER